MAVIYSISFSREQKLQNNKNRFKKKKKKAEKTSASNRVRFTRQYFTRMRVEVMRREGRERDRGKESLKVVHTRLIYSSLRGRRTIHARQQLLHIISRLLPYSQ